MSTKKKKKRPPSFILLAGVTPSHAARRMYDGESRSSKACDVARNFARVLFPHSLTSNLHSVFRKPGVVKELRDLRRFSRPGFPLDDQDLMIKTDVRG